MKSTQLAMALLGRELRERYLSTFAGLAWVLITPVMLLAIYAFVFVELLGARFGNRVGGDVIAFLALVWPWHAFADSLARGTSALTGNAALIGQTAIPRVWLVLVPKSGLHPSSSANVPDMSLAFNKVMGQGLWIIVGSMVAFLVGQILDVFIFHKIKSMTGEKWIWLRATGSTMVSQLIDSYLVLFIAFYIGAEWELTRVLAIGTVNYFYKSFIAISLTPVIYWSHNIIDKYRP